MTNQPDATTSDAPSKPTADYQRGYDAGLHDLKALTAEEDAYRAAATAPHQSHSELADRLEALAGDCDEGEKNIWENHEWVEAAKLLRDAAKGLRQRPAPEPSGMREALLDVDLIASMHGQPFTVEAFRDAMQRIHDVIRKTLASTSPTGATNDRD